MTETAGELSAPDGVNTIAYRQQSGREPTIVFLHGFRSDMTGTKAEYLANLCRKHDLGYLRFDYRGHGKSRGHYTEFTIGDWLADALQVIDELTTGPLILVGSSLGGWLMIRAAEERSARIKGMVAVAPALDFPTRLVLPALEPKQRELYATKGHVVDPKSTFVEPTILTKRLIEESVSHNRLGSPPPFAGPIRLFQGMQDDAVPWPQTMELAQNWQAPDLRVTLYKDGDHRLNEPAQLAELGRAVVELSGATV
jgi:alpha-beta hydrolase superfamily lysophospholipase